MLSAGCKITDHGVDVEVRGKVTRNTVHCNESWQLQAAQDHRVLCRDTTRRYDVDSQPQQHHKIVHRCIWHMHRLQYPA